MKSNEHTPVIKRTLNLRFNMSYLDNAIGDCSEEVKKCIDNMWDAIEELEDNTNDND